MKKLLWVGDASCQTGFAKSTHAVLDVLRHSYDVAVLGINYRGDPHNYPYPIYTAAAGGDAFGVKRLLWTMDTVKPDILVLQNDPWNIPAYIHQIKKAPEYADIPVIGFLAVDGQSVRKKWFEGLSLAIFWSEFAKKEAEIDGCKIPMEVIPLGVDITLFKPVDKKYARRHLGFPDTFIIGNINRNQPRKRLDLSLRYFAKFIQKTNNKDALLFLHVAPTGDPGYALQFLAHHYKLQGRVLFNEPAMFEGVTDEELALEYNVMDLSITTTQGEGFGLTTFEAMACGIPVIAPDWSALGEHCKDAVRLIPCTSTCVTPGPGIGIIGGVPDEELFIASLEDLYKSQDLRNKYSQAGLARVAESQYRWENVGKAFAQTLEHHFAEVTV